MGNVTFLDFLVCFIHLIWYFAGLFSELSLIALSGFISRLVGFGVPTRLFTSMLIIGTILMILFPFQPQYDPHEYYENVNGHLYEALQYHLYRQNRPPIIGHNYSREIARKNIANGMATLQITFNDTIAEDNEEIPTISQRRSSNENLNEFLDAKDVELEKIEVMDTTIRDSKIVEIPDNYKLNHSNLFYTEKIDNDIEDNNLKLVNKIEDIELSDVNSILNDKIVSKDSTSSSEINSFRRDTIEQIEKVVSVIEPNSTLENSDDQLRNANSREPSEEVEEFLSVINITDINEDIL